MSSQVGRAYVCVGGVCMAGGVGCGSVVPTGRTPAHPCPTPLPPASAAGCQASAHLWVMELSRLQAAHCTALTSFMRPVSNTALRPLSLSRALHVLMWFKNFLQQGPAMAFRQIGISHSISKLYRDVKHASSTLTRPHSSPCVIDFAPALGRKSRCTRTPPLITFT